MREETKQGFLLEDFRLFHLVSERGISTAPHYHEFCKILVLLRGRGEYLVDGCRYELLPGDLVLVGAYSVHKADLSPAEGYERIILYLSPDYLNRISAPDCNFLSLFSPQNGHVLRPKGEHLARLAQMLDRDLQDNDFGRELLAGADLIRFLVYLGRARHVSRPAPLVPQDPRVRAILQYLDEHLTEDISIEALAERFYVSRYHMMRQFKTETGISIHQYLTQKRVTLARAQISSGMSATEACYRSGFGSYSSFTRACGKLLGTSPTGRGGDTPEE